MGDRGSVKDPEERRSSVPSLEALLVRAGALWRSPRGLAVAVLGVTFSLLHLFTAFFGPPEAQVFRSTHLAFVLVLAFLLYPSPSRLGGLPIGRMLDGVCIGFVVAIQAYILHDIEAFNAKAGLLTTSDIWTGTIFIALVLEATRRTVGWSMVLTSLFFLLQAVYADHFPLVFYGPPTSWRTLVDNLFFQEIGIFGVPIAVMASYIVLFLLFSALLVRSGGGEYFVALAFSLTGRRPGGPAKAAVVSSALFGTVSGSAVANVMTTGTFTIPLMKRVGYRPAFAGGVEAVASSGGQIMPPVMGAAAFILAEFLGLPYLEVAKAAVIPALLYFFSLWLMVHFEAKRSNIQRTAVARYRVAETLRDGGHLFVPFLVIMAVLLGGFSVARAGFLGVASVVVLSLLRRHSRLTPMAMLSSLADGARATVPVSVAAAAAGIIIGAVTSSGVGARFTSLLLSASNESLWLALVLAMLASFVLGMGLTTSADYILLAILAVPALVDLGVMPLAAHMFAFYFSSISGITPPVALAAFAAAGIAGSGMMQTGLAACRIGIAAFLIPYLFVYSPAILMKGTFREIAVAFVTSVLGVLCLAGGVQGWLVVRTTRMERVLLVLAAGLLIKPGIVTDVAGFGLFAAVLAIQTWTRGSRAPAGNEAPSTALADDEPLADKAPSHAVSPGGGELPSWGLLVALVGVMAWAGSSYVHVSAFNAFLLSALAVGGVVVCSARALAARQERR
jgi:TRAP transporter 4TM/12TM fusion protein